MSTLLEQASLVMIPSGYKEDVVYSQIPTDGSGDLAFTRASNGTRVNSAGLVEVTPWNLLQQSNTFNTTWAPLSGASVTGGQAGYDGTNNAWLLSKSAVGGFIYQSSNSYNGQYTISVYAKANTLNYIRLNGNADTDSEGIFNLSNGTINYQLNCVAEITSVGGGWYRCSITSSDVILDYVNIYPAPQSASSGSIYIQNAQLNTGALKPYFPTTDRLNVPRLTYQNGGGGCPSLLLEKQSTNQILYSEQLDDALWLKGNISVTANNTTSPDGTQNADKITNTTISAVYLYQKSQVSASTWSYSFYAKKGTNKYLGISLCSETYQATSRYQPVFDLDNGTLQTINQSGSNETNTSYSINAVGNGWYKITASFTLSAGADFTFIVFSSSNNTSYNPASGNLDWQNATIGDYYLWGVQGEASSYPTSYIPTTSSSATRVADACFKNGISSLIGQSEGTLFFEGSQIGAATTVPFQLSDTTNANRVQIEIGSSGQPLLVASSAGTTQAVIVGSSYTIGQNRKIAVTYKNNDFRLYQNGVLIGSDTSGTVPVSLSAIYLGSEAGTPYLDVQIKQIVNFKTSLSNAECIALTTL